MEDILDATFYQDDFLTKTLTSSVLYDKNQLDLTFSDNNNISKDKNLNQNLITQNEVQNRDSPDLDFLNLGSPDLEQMLFNIDENNDSNFSTDGDNLGNTNFDIDEDLINAENCFTDALQQLHDKGPSIPDLIMVDMATNKEEKIQKLHPQNNSNKPESNGTSQHLVNSNISKPKPTRVMNKPQHLNLITNNNHNTRPFYNNNILPNAHPQPIFNKPFHQHVNALPLQRQHSSIPQNLPANHVSLSEQMVLNDQMALMNGMSQDINAQQLQQQQQQRQEIAFLTQAMGFHNERENMQPHLMNGGSYPQHINQISNQLQQKILEQQLLQQQMNGNFPMNSATQMGHLSLKDPINVDEQTLKLFIENPQLAPINLEIQELIKRERKKLRNRIASSKCRKRKLEREGKLEDRVKDLKEKNIELNAIANALKQQICDLKQRVMDHVGEGCQIVMPS